MLCVSCCLRREGVGPSTRFPSSRREEQFLCFALSGPKRSYSRNLGARSFSYKPLCSTEMPQLGDSPKIKDHSQTLTRCNCLQKFGVLLNGLAQFVLPLCDDGSGDTVADHVGHRPAH